MTSLCKAASNSRNRVSDPGSKYPRTLVNNFGLRRPARLCISRSYTIVLDPADVALYEGHRRGFQIQQHSHGVRSMQYALENVIGTSNRSSQR